ncbi:ABC transporter substrate-binding protein [Lentzea sp. BCCO 10_0798]|uniref:ABC transporter substrate-binding protein n=1 Tax=Lentzea kristufekii TaxID=3095430 RepID=A0ABU4TQK7_9PSEU|nr:ABC transporter substrate-binding protein [Lentzea sp. BCCO 10_0798]MDX8050383.1 ABC transporter substrate-binding protein [Lentzea sp. BCCO 10_0798]
MALEPEIGLVGRDDITALVESLVERRAKHPLPVIVAFGPGGSGKTSLLDHVHRRYRDAPTAKVDLDKAGSRSCKDILDVAAEQLRSYQHAEFGRMRLPRYDLARLALYAEPADDPHHRARELAAKQMTRLVAVADAAEVVEMLPPAQGLGKVLRPLLLWLIGLAVVAPRPLRWLLGGPRVASALRWFENYVGEELKAGPGSSLKFDAALVHTWSLNRAGDTLEIDRLLVAAFLADITAAYRFRRYRRMNSLLLLDGADLLDGIDSYLPPKRPRPAARATDFLSLLAERRAKEPHVPLLVIATKQSAPSLPDSPVFKPVRLEPFTLAQTRQFLAEWNRTRNSTVESEALVEELQEVTHGHPLAVRLAIQLVQFVFARDQVLPSVRSVFDERLPVDETTTFQDATVGDYLLLRFFQRIPGTEEMPEREAAREIFARLAAPRVLDRHVIRALLPPSWSAENMRALLAQLSFVRQEGDNFLLHPLLRDLLARRLREVPADQPFSHVHVHRLLKDRYDSLGQREDALYHALALGQVHLVAHRLRPHVDERSDRWIAELAAIAEAPMPPGEGEPEHEEEPRTWWERLRSGTTRNLHRRYDSVVRPETGLLEDAVVATWELRSRSRTDRPTVEMYDRVLRAHQELDGAEERLTSYRATKRALEHNTPASPPASLPRPSTVGRFPYPWRWPGRNSVRRVTVYLVVVLLVVYGAAFCLQNSTHCLRYGVLEPAELVADLSGERPRMSKMDGVQCVGLSEKPGRFAYGDPATQNNDDAEVGELAKLIAEENDRAAKVKDRSVVTIVVATMLSSSERVKRDLSAGVNELRGAYLAQRDWNQLDGLGRNPLVRLVLANFGGESKYAVKVAEQIRAYAERDPSVIAVTGLGQSRETTQSALAVLGPSKDQPAGIPMVGSSLSSTSFSQKPYFFRVAPANDRQAQVAARIIERTEALRGRPMHLVRSPGDEYSSDLADQFQDVLKPERHDYDETANAVTTQLGQVVTDICGKSPNPLILYTGRTAEVGGLLTELSHSNCTDPVVFGGDDLTQLETTNFTDLEDIKRFADGRLYFTTFAWAPSREPIPQPTQQFFTTYEAAQKKHAHRAFLSGPNGHVLLAYDAISVVARHTSVGASRENVYDRLRTLRDFPGASGRLTFDRTGASGTSGADPVDKLVVGQIVKLDNGFLASHHVSHEGT